MVRYVIIIIHTDKGRVWEVRRKGRIFWKELGQFNSEFEATQCANEDGENSGSGWTQEYSYVDRRKRKGFNVWVLEYHTCVGGQYCKEKEEFLSGWEARLHKWIYSFDKTKFRFSIEKEERGV